MRPLLLSGFGIKISVDRRKLIIESHKKLEFYPHQIPYDNVIIDGYYGMITFEAIRWLMKHQIALSILNWDGSLLGVTLPEEPLSGKLRIKQYNSYLDNAKRLSIAEKIIDKKIEKSHELLSELSKYYKGINKTLIDNTFSYEKRTYPKDNANRSIRNLMTYEGRVADIYWKTLSKVFNDICPEFNFKSRKNKSYSHGMNASDYVNALLNYGYAIEESVIRKAINTIGLDPNIGFLHEISSGKQPLVYDLQELYRWLIDLSIIQLLEEKKLKKSDFLTTENYHIKLRERAAKQLLEKIAMNFNKRMEFRGKFHTYDNILLENVRNLAKYLENDNKVLEFEFPFTRIERNDNLLTRETIMAITPEERKRLGINKSTLWYRQKAIKEGKKIKIYDLQQKEH
jgi:CRISPR-associated protein Cas1